MTEKDRLLLHGARLIDPWRRREVSTDIYLERGVIRAIGRRLGCIEAEVWDLGNRYVAPGFVDLHCHLREPGREDEETIRTGTSAALAGGFTTVCCMPNTSPAIDNENVVRAVLAEAELVGQAQVVPIGAATKGRLGRELTEVGSLVKAGVRAISDDGNPISDSLVMRRVLEYARAFDIPVVSHCEDRQLSAGAAMHEGVVSARLGLPGSPACAEAAMVMRDILLAEHTRSRVHIAHVSTRLAVEMIRWAKRKGWPVTCETCPHYFTLTDRSVAGFDANFKVNPPLRSDDDAQAVREGLSDGTIDAIATDHAPHLSSEKEMGFEQAPPGMIGLETAFALGLEELVNKGYLSLIDYITCLTVSPAQILGLDKRLAVGDKADLVIFDPTRQWVYESRSIRSKSRNSPFVGQRLTGRVQAVVIGTRVFEF